MKGLDTFATSCHAVIALLGGIVDLVADVDGGCLGGIYSSHDNLCFIDRTAHHVTRIGDHEGAHLIDAHIATIDALHEAFDSLSFGIADIALQLGKNGDGSSDGDIFEHLVFPGGERRAGL